MTAEPNPRPLPPVAQTPDYAEAETVLGEWDPEAQLVGALMHLRNPQAVAILESPSNPVISGTPALERIRAAGETVVHTSPPASEDDLIQRLHGAHTVINIRGYSKFNTRVLDTAGGTLKHLAIWGTGTDNVDLAAARRLGVVVSNTPNTATDAIAEHCLALVLTIARHLPQLDANVKQIGWERGMLFQCLGMT